MVDLAEAVAGLDAGLAVERRADGVSLRARHGERLPLDVVSLKSPRPSDIDRLTRESRPVDAVPVVVADRVVPRVREQLVAAGWGWLDRGGRLRLVAGPVVVDTDVPRVEREVPDARAAAVDTTVGLAVATAVLSRPRERLSVRALVSFTGHSLGAVHHALRLLRDEGLIDSHGRPVAPDLFWEASGRWRPRRVALRSTPRRDDAGRTEQLGLGLDNPTANTGWALCDTLAANALGASAVVRGSFPPDFYAPHERILRVCRRLYGDAVAYESRGATVALPPVQWACSQRLDRVRPPRPKARDEWPVVHPVIAALDLSVDPGRGREILDEWEPAPPYERVW